MIWRLRNGDGTPDGVEGGVVAIGENLPVKFVGTGLGEDFDAAIAERVILRGERILIDANFANGSLRWNLSASESIDIDLAAIGAGGWAGERLQFGLKLIGIIGERFEILTFDDDGAGIFGGIDSDSCAFGFDLDFFLLGGDAEREIELLRGTCYYVDVGLGVS